MGFIIKTVFGAAFFGLLAYGVFFKEIGGQTLSSHASEVWSSKTVQKKVDVIRDSVRQELEQKLAESKAKTVARAKDEALDQLSEADRRSLQELLERKTAERAQR